jgi:predicted transcriptional regulator of viral defense system
MLENFILEIYKKPQTIFTFKEISLLFPQLSYKNLKSKVSYFARAGKLKRVRKGIYAKEDFNFLELANKIYTPSYISFETVLEKEGIIFQKYQTIFVASYLSRKIKIGEQEIFYRKIKSEVLLNSLGVEERNFYFIASKERAFLDSIFLYKDYYFDNLQPINWDRVEEIKKIYSSKILEKRVAQYYKIYKRDAG